MQHRLFPQDKNYILKQVQVDTELAQLRRLVELVKKEYLLRYNPLGLEDNTVKAIKEQQNYQLDPLSSFYFDLCVIYRYKNKSNQLDIPFDGRSHYQRFSDEWSDALAAWALDFCQFPHFIRTVLETCVLYTPGARYDLVRNRLKQLIQSQFKMKVYKSKAPQAHEPRRTKRKMSA